MRKKYWPKLSHLSKWPIFYANTSAYSEVTGYQQTIKKRGEMAKILTSSRQYNKRQVTVQHRPVTNGSRILEQRNLRRLPQTCGRANSCLDFWTALALE
jgi:hypothetical protein